MRLVLINVKIAFCIFSFLYDYYLTKENSLEGKSVKKTLLISSLCLFVTTWGLKPTSTFVNAKSPPVVKQSNDSTRTAPAAQPEVELLNAGIEPRQELRFKPTVNAKQTATMTMNMSVAMAMAGQSFLPKVNLPATVVTMDTVVTQVDSNGDIHYRFSYSDVEVVGNTTLPPKELETLRLQLEQMRGASGSGIVDNRGQTKKANFVLPKGLDENLKQMMEQMSSFQDQLSSPVPEEAIGIGAKWRISSSPNLNGMNLNQIETYELVSLKDNVATLNVNIEQHAKQQNLNQAGLPPGVTLTLKSHDSQGEAQVTMLLNQLIPTRSTLSFRSNDEMNIRADKMEEMIMSTRLSMEIVLESK
jgi:hypothetical protein